MKKNEFAQYFSEFLEKNNYKLDYVAKELNSAKSTMSQYKNGGRIPQDEVVENFIKVFKFSEKEAKNIRRMVNRDRSPEIIIKELDDLKKEVNHSKDKLTVVELTHQIPVYSKVFAGENGVLEFGELIEYINIPSLRNGTEIIGIKVDGDSMERTIPQGATILVKKDIEVSDNEIGVFIHNNNPLVKRFRKKENEVYLMSDNNNYMPICVREGDEFYIVGKVVEYLCKL